jgi:hypothetical protein
VGGRIRSSFTRQWRGQHESRFGWVNVSRVCASRPGKQSRVKWARVARLLPARRSGGNCSRGIRIRNTHRGSTGGPHGSVVPRRRQSHAWMEAQLAQKLSAHELQERLQELLKNCSRKRGLRTSTRCSNRRRPVHKLSEAQSTRRKIGDRRRRSAYA